MTKTTIYLARHGETEWNRIRRLQGRLDSPLTPQGIEQANLLAKKMLDCDVDRIISSPLGRAVATAEYCQRRLKRELTVESQLQERDFGAWQERLFDELCDHADFESVFFQVTKQAPPDGEPGVTCGIRIWNCLSSLAKQYPSKRLLVISHGDAIRCFFSQINQTGAVDAYSQYGNGKVFELNFLHINEEFVLV